VKAIAKTLDVSRSNLIERVETLRPSGKPIASLTIRCFCRLYANSSMLAPHTAIDGLLRFSIANFSRSTNLA